MQYDDLYRCLIDPIKRPKKSGFLQSHKSRCPCHEDNKQSLITSEKADGKILIYDQAGCDTKDIIHALGLEVSDVFDTKEPECLERLRWFYANKYTYYDESGKKHEGYGDGVRIAAEYKYIKCGKYLYSKIRFEGGQIDGKLIRYYEIDREKDESRPCNENRPHELYRYDEFLRYRKESKYAFYVEGEKDVETMVKNGYLCCTTAGGSNDWRAEFAEVFKGLNVVIIADNDQPGKKSAEKIRKDLRRYAHSIRIITPSDEHHGDVTDYLTKEGGTVQELNEMIEKADVVYAAWVIMRKDTPAGINAGILASIMAANEPHIIVRSPKDDKDQFFRLNDGKYEQLNKPAIKAAVREYIPISMQTDNLLNNVASLMFATSENIHALPELNADGRYIPVLNGMYDIEGKRVIPHSPKVFNTFQYPFILDIGSDGIKGLEQIAKTAKHFMKFIREFASKDDGTVDEEMILIIQEYLGFLISNEPMAKIKKVLMLWSRLGNSGKSVVIRLVINLLGLDRVASIKLKELTADNRFILGTLPESRVIACGDESNSNITDSSIFKSVTGGDPVKIEPKGKQGFSFVYQGGFVIACNGLPCFTDDKGDHLFDRLIILPCEHHVTEDTKDPELDEKLKKELQGIFAWSLIGLHRLRDNNFVFTKSEASETAKREYHGMMDSVFRFISEFYDVTHDFNDRTSKTAFDDAYQQWAFQNDGIKPVEKRNLAARMESLGFSNGCGNVGEKRNIAYYRGLKPKETEDSDTNNESLQEELPFD